MRHHQIGNIDLKPCPFCGGEACPSFGFSVRDDRERITYTIVCKVCKTAIFRPSFDGWDGYTSVEMAAADWNRRAEVRCGNCRHNGLLRCPLVRIEKQELVFLNHDPNWFCGDWEAKEAE